MSVNSTVAEDKHLAGQQGGHRPNFHCEARGEPLTSSLLLLQSFVLTPAVDSRSHGMSGLARAMLLPPTSIILEPLDFSRLRLSVASWSGTWVTVGSMDCGAELSVGNSFNSSGYPDNIFGLWLFEVQTLEAEDAMRVLVFAAALSCPITWCRGHPPY